jgi:hypothetical protein
MMDYLNDAKELSKAAAGDLSYEGMAAYSAATQALASIAIAEQLKRIADELAELNRNGLVVEKKEY